jgi:ubiquinone/menaquinone biosynthesis C-methylase UbiE
MADSPVQSAARTWDNPVEPLETTNARIHDGVPLHQLEARADGYAKQIFDQFPQIVPRTVRTIVEVGSGTGYIMEAVERYLNRSGVQAASITGLDIAPNMLAKAKARLGDRTPFAFLEYDGIHVPLPDASLDLIYSVAALQHIPKVYVYNLFLEMHRLLAPGGHAVLHFPSFRQIPEHVRYEPWSNEIRRQMNNETGHWHHFYSVEELEYVLRDASQFRNVDLRAGTHIWACVANG